MFNFLEPTTIISILIALTVHEWAHAYSANKLGDPTAAYAGRVTLNPIAHLDVMGTIFFFLVGFGWGKPVPIDPRYFKHERRDTAIVAAAGPFSNLILAIIALALLLFAFGENSLNFMNLISANNGPNTVSVMLQKICSSSIFINLSLLAFNLLPIAPLDGSKILRLFIPAGYTYEYEKFMVNGPMILLFLLLIDNFGSFSFISIWIYGISKFILSILLTIFS